MDKGSTRVVCECGRRVYINPDEVFQQCKYCLYLCMLPDNGPYIDDLSPLTQNINIEAQ